MMSDYEAQLVQSMMTTSLKITREVKDMGGDGFSITGSYGGVKLTYADRVHDMPTRESCGIGSVVGYSRGSDYSNQSSATMHGSPKIDYIHAEGSQKSLGCLVGYNRN